MQAGERLNANDAAGLEMTCAEFLERHSEYVDGMVTPAMAAIMDAHAAACVSCGRYDRIVRRGADLLVELPTVQPSQDFEARLQHRIFHVMDAQSLAQPRTSGIVAVLGIAAMVAFIAWSPLLVALRDEADAPVASTTDNTSDATADAARVRPEAAVPSDLRGRPVRGVVIGDAESFGAMPAWYPPSMPATPLHQPSDILALFPGPHSPLVVTPPSHRSVRTVSTSQTVE